jgi:DNA-binding GntR family transcriptional regulator
VFENELRLADDMGLSRPTMRRAMQHLVDKGLVVRRRGIGTRVVQPKVRRPLELTSLFDDLSVTGQAPTTEVLAFEHEPATADVAEALQVAPDDPIVRIERVRSAHERPIAKMTNYLPERVVGFDSGDLRDHGLYELLRAQGVQLHAATQTVGARTATTAEARMLGEPSRSALLTMSRLTYDDHGTLVEYATHLYAASRYAFEINLLRP